MEVLDPTLRQPSFSDPKGGGSLELRCWQGDLDGVQKARQNLQQQQHKFIQGDNDNHFYSLQKGQDSMMERESTQKTSLGNNQSSIAPFSPLCAAVLGGHVNVICALLDLDEKLLLAKNQDMSPEAAIRSFHAKTREKDSALKLQVDINDPGKSHFSLGLTPLMMCCLLGQERLVQIFLDMDAAINAQSRVTGWTAMMYAVSAFRASSSAPFNSPARVMNDCFAKHFNSL